MPSTLAKDRSLFLRELRIAKHQQLPVEPWSTYFAELFGVERSREVDVLHLGTNGRCEAVHANRKEARLHHDGPSPGSSRRRTPQSTQDNESIQGPTQATPDSITLGQLASGQPIVVSEGTLHQQKGLVVEAVSKPQWFRTPKFAITS